MQFRGPMRRGLRSVATGEWLCLAIFAIGLWQLKWVSDDGYIYLTYVQNFVDLGNGPVFNVGERVEAFTSPLWFALLSLVAFIVPRSLVELAELTTLVGVLVSLAAVALWIPIERASRRPSLSGERAVVLNVPLAIVAGVYVFRSFGTSGLETPLLLLWLGATVLTIYTRVPRRWALAGLAGVAPLVRPDLGLVALGLVVVLIVVCRRDQPTRREVSGLVGLVVIPMLVMSAIRVSYYAQLAPNTYYAKTGAGHGVSDGLNYLADVTSVYGLPWVLLGAVAVLLAGRPGARKSSDGDAAFDFDRWRSERRAVLLALMVLSAAYVIWVGGDFMHGRFWITPWVFLLGALAGCGSDLIAKFADREQINGRALVATAAVAAVTVTAINLTFVPAQRRMVDEGSGFIDGIADEGAFYAQQNPNLHDLGAANLSAQYGRGIVVAEMAALIGEEIGIAQGAVGQVAFAGQQSGAVYVFDMAGLTRTVGSRIAPLPGGRVGHAKVAPDVLVAMHERVDLWFEAVDPVWLPAEADFAYGGYKWRLGNPAMADQLVAAGILERQQADALDDAYVAALNGPMVDANLVTYLTARASDDAPYRARLDELRLLGETSQWRRWDIDTAADRQTLGQGGCPASNPLVCLGRSIDRHRVAPITSPDGPDLRPVPASD